MAKLFSGDRSAAGTVARGVGFTRGLLRRHISVHFALASRAVSRGHPVEPANLSDHHAQVGHRDAARSTTPPIGTRRCGHLPSRRAPRSSTWRPTKIVNSVEVSGERRSAARWSPTKDRPRTSAPSSPCSGRSHGALDAEVERFARSFKPANASFEPEDFAPSQASSGPAPSVATPTAGSQAAATPASVAAAAAMPAAATAAAAKPAAATPAPSAATSPGEVDGGMRVSPIARRIADRLGVDVAKVTGTGRNGRVSKEDVEAYAVSMTRDGTARAPAAPRGPPRPSPGARGSPPCAQPSPSA